MYLRTSITSVHKGFDWFFKLLNQQRMLINELFYNDEKKE